MNTALDNNLTLDSDETVIFETTKHPFQPYYLVAVAVCIGLGFINGPNPFLIVAIVGTAFVFLIGRRTRLWLTNKRIIFAEKHGALASFKQDSIQLQDIEYFWKGNVARFGEDPELHRQNMNQVAGVCDLTIVARMRSPKCFEALQQGHAFAARLASTLGFTSRDGYKWSDPHG